MDSIIIETNAVTIYRASTPDTKRISLALQACGLLALDEWIDPGGRKKLNAVVGIKDVLIGL